MFAQHGQHCTQIYSEASEVDVMGAIYGGSAKLAAIQVKVVYYILPSPTGLETIRGSFWKKKILYYLALVATT